MRHEPPSALLDSEAQTSCNEEEGNSYHLEEYRRNSQGGLKLTRPIWERQGLLFGHACKR